MIATRADPPLSLARLRARRQMIEIRQADLHFTAAQAATLLNEVPGLDQSPPEVEALHERSEGWVSGLQMAALALRDAAGPANGRRASKHSPGASATSSIICWKRSCNASRRQVLP